jgi:hypothetical protein
MATPSKAEQLIDYTKWEAASLTDKRSPCPMLNALANHHILPHDGRKISKEVVVKAIYDAINLDTHVGNVFASVALKVNPDNTALPFTSGQNTETFDLDQLAKHGVIEHDVSLSRNDLSLGDNLTFDDSVWDGVLASYEGRTETDFHSASKARWDRVATCKKAHQAAERKIEYGIKEVILSYGETALLLALLGDPKDGKIPIKYLKTLFGK